MAKSVKANYLFNLINSASQLLFPLVTFPYASRIMMADGIGQVNFFQSIISYISLFTCLGIPMYAMREVAKVRDNGKKMTQIAVEILLLHAFLSLLGYVVVAIVCMIVPQVQTNVPLFLILSVTIFFTAIGCEWFYQGIEDFKYVAVRGLIVKSVSIVLLFLLVKTKEDILWYGIYTVLGTLGGNVFNFIRLRKYLYRNVVHFSTLHPFRHLKPALQIFVFNVIVSIYLQLNNVLLGFMKDAEAVGYFTAATKIMIITMSVSGALGTVMIPRTSNLIAEGKMNEFKLLIQKSYDFILAITMPLTVGLIFISKSAILLLSGDGFVPAILTSQIVAFNILMVGISGVMGLQVLYPMGKINIVIICTGIGAVINVLLNVWLIPKYGHKAFYQLLMGKDSNLDAEGKKELAHGVFASTGGNPSARQLEGLIRTAKDATFHLGFDMDEAGQKFAEQFKALADREGVSRDRIVQEEPSEEYKDFNDELLDHKISAGIDFDSDGDVEVNESEEKQYHRHR